MLFGFKASKSKRFGGHRKQCVNNKNKPEAMAVSKMFIINVYVEEKE